MNKNERITQLQDRLQQKRTEEAIRRRLGKGIMIPDEAHQMTSDEIHSMIFEEHIEPAGIIKLDLSQIISILRGGVLKFRIYEDVYVILRAKTEALRNIHLEEDNSFKE